MSHHPTSLIPLIPSWQPVTSASVTIVTSSFARPRSFATPMGCPSKVPRVQPCVLSKKQHGQGWVKLLQQSCVVFAFWNPKKISKRYVGRVGDLHPASGFFFCCWYCGGRESCIASPKGVAGSRDFMGWWLYSMTLVTIVLLEQEGLLETATVAILTNPKTATNSNCSLKTQLLARTL